MRRPPAEMELLRPDWPAAVPAMALATTRGGGVSQAPFDALNLGTHVGDDPGAVQINRDRLAGAMSGVAAVWLDQVHGVAVRRLTQANGAVPRSDACWTDQPGLACAILAADCLPVLLADRAGSVVAAAHCGWRSLSGGILDRLLDDLPAAPGDLLAWLGPAICVTHYEVGSEVVNAFCAGAGAAAREIGFAANARGRYQCDLAALARWRLSERGVVDITGGELCTFGDRRFFSYRRSVQGVCGRTASLVWLPA